MQSPSFADGTEAFQELDDMNEQLDQCLDDDREEAANRKLCYRYWSSEIYRLHSCLIVYILEVSIPEKVLYAFIVLFQERYLSHEGGGLLLLFLNCILTLLPLSNFFTFPRLATVCKLSGIDSMLSQGSIYVACSACHALYAQQHSVVVNSRGKHVKYPDHPTQRPKRCDTALYIRAHGHYVPRKVFAYSKVKDCIRRLMSRAGVPSSTFNPGFGCCLEYKLYDLLRQFKDMSTICRVMSKKGLRKIHKGVISQKMCKKEKRLQMRYVVVCRTMSIRRKQVSQEKGR